MSAVVTVSDVKEEEASSSFADMIKNDKLFTVIFEEIEETATRLAYLERKKMARYYPTLIQIVDEYCRVTGEGASFKKGVAFGLLLVLQQKEAEGSEFREYLAAKRREAEKGAAKVEERDPRRGVRRKT